MTITTTLESLPAGPQRSDPATFADKADAWNTAMETKFQPQMEDVITEVNSTADDVNTDAATATTMAGTATTMAGTATTQAGIATTGGSTATTQAGVATTQAGIATTQAGIATTKAAEAAASAASIAGGPVASFNGLTGIVNATNATIPLATAGVGVVDMLTTADAFRHFTTGSVTEGGDVTDNGNGTFNIAACEVVLRTSAVEDAPLVVKAVAAAGPFTPTDGAVTYYYVDYNSGTPIWSSGTATSDYNGMDKMQAYTVARRGTRLCFIDARGQSIDGNRKTRRLLLEISGLANSGFWHTRGGSALTGSGLNLVCTAGKFYYGLAPILHDAFNTATAGIADANVFDYYYNRSTWTYIVNSKTINNTQYDSAGTLTTLTNGRYRTDWCYLVLCNDMGRLVVVMGNGQSTTLSAAQAVPAPSSVPGWLNGSSVLLGQIIVLKNDTTLTVASSFNSVFTGASVPAHNDLGALQGGTSGEYYHLTVAQVSSLDVAAASQNIFFLSTGVI